MNYIEYNGYLGTVEFSPEDLVFHGKIHGKPFVAVNYM